MGQTSSTIASTTTSVAAAARPAVVTTAAGGRPAVVTTAKTTATGRVVVATSAKATPTTTSAAPASTSGLANYLNLGCYQDNYSSGRVLNGYAFTSSGMTIELCESTCNSQGYQVAGLESGSACYCGNAISQCATKLSSSSCAIACSGRSNSLCGGNGALNVYAVQGYSVSTQGCSTPTSTLVTSTKAPTVTSQGGVSTGSTSISAGSQYTSVPGASGANKVFAHFMIGNTYSMQSVSDYQTQIAKAISMGIDGFACNIGSDSWQPNRLSLMYAAAQSYPNFVLFVSLDMAVLAGVSFSYLYQFITPYASHPNQYRISGKQFVSTFAGESYTGGQSDPATAWLYFKNQLSAMGTNIYFVPAFTGYGATCLGWDALDGALSWNAWTKDTSEDNYYLLSRNNPSTYTNTNIKTGYGTGNTAIYKGKTYMAGIGPLFFTHFNYKNWVYSNDDLYLTRWENIVTEQPDFVEIISWNDYGESHYIGDIVGSLPYDSNGVQSSSWAYKPQFDHTPLSTLTQYYIAAYKNRGAYPTVTQNSLTMWYRPHSINAIAPNDPYGKPSCQSATCPVDNIYLALLLTGPATVTVTSGGASQQFSGSAGLNKFQFVGFGTGTPSVTVVMGGSTRLSQTATLAISNTITAYNYNLHYDAWTF